MRCVVCGAELTATSADLPFKARETSTVILKGFRSCDARVAPNT